MKTLLYLSMFSMLFTSCISSEKDKVVGNYSSETNVITPEAKVEDRQISEAFKKYWYAGNAEITSYALTQERYGELRKGTAVNVYVTEDFLAKEQVKADGQSPKNIPVLKLNTTKKYTTGIYPYSVMNSTFSPVNTKDHAIKTSLSMQEWCGQVYVQLNNRKEYEVILHSYFQGEADQNLKLKKSWLESDLWNRIRISPQELPTGELTVLPGFEYFRMSHKKIQAQTATGKIVMGDSISTYSLLYPELKRELKIYFTSKFPHTIERWEETHPSGLQTTATKLKRIKSPYWGQNSNKFNHLRDSLGL